MSSIVNNVLVRDGSDIAPSYSFVNKRDTGIYYDSVNAISFSTNGMRRASITQNGYIDVVSGNYQDNGIDGRVIKTSLGDGSTTSDVGVGSGASLNGSASNNIIIGSSAGITPTTNVNNTIIGARADVNAGFANASAIGHNALADKSNIICLGDTLIDGNTESRQRYM